MNKDNKDTKIKKICSNKNHLIEKEKYSNKQTKIKINKSNTNLKNKTELKKILLIVKPIKNIFFNNNKNINNIEIFISKIFKLIKVNLIKVKPLKINLDSVKIKINNNKIKIYKQ